MPFERRREEGDIYLEEIVGIFQFLIFVPCVLCYEQGRVSLKEDREYIVKYRKVSE